MTKPEIREFSDWDVKRIRARLLAYFIKQNRIYEAQLKRLKVRERADRNNADSLKQPSFMTLTMEIVTDEACLDWLYFENELTAPTAQTYQEELSDLDDTDPPHRAGDQGAFLTERTVQGFLGGDEHSATSPVKQVHYTRPPDPKLTPIYQFLRAKRFATDEMLTDISPQVIPQGAAEFFGQFGLEPVPILECQHFKGDYYAQTRNEDYDYRISLTIQTNPEKTAYRIHISRFAYQRLPSEPGILRRQRIERGQYNTLQQYSGWALFSPGHAVLVILQELESDNPEIVRCWIPCIKSEEKYWVSHKDRADAKRKNQKKAGKKKYFIIKNFFTQFDLRSISHPLNFDPAPPAAYDEGALLDDPSLFGEWNLRFYANYSRKLHNYDGDIIMTDNDDPKKTDGKRKKLSGSSFLGGEAKYANDLSEALSEKETMTATQLIDRHFDIVEKQNHLRHGKDVYLKKTPELTPADKFLYLVSFSGNHEAIAEILAAGFDVNAKGTHPSGASALHCAARYSSRFIVLELMKHEGIDYLARDTEGRIPSVYAIQNYSSHEVICWLMKAEKRQAAANGIDYEALHPGPHPRLEQPEFYPDPTSG